jgi:3-oxoacyl-[acyl-carrier protein] reductase
MIDPRLQGKTVFITGANHGIGESTARAFAQQGAHVFLTYHRVPSARTTAELEEAKNAGNGGPLLYAARQLQTCDALVEDLRGTGVRASAHEADLFDHTRIPWLFDRCEAEIGPVDILVVNHTYCVLETFDPARAREDGFPVYLVSQPQIDAHFAVNARACALLMREYVQRTLHRAASWGRIINISTDAAHAHDENVSYAASKHAIESYSRSAASELGRYGITVNVVAPGPIQTGYLTPQQETEIAGKTPLGRVGNPNDVADAIVFLASEQARWLTGQLLYVGGGWRMPQ